MEIERKKTRAEEREFYKDFIYPKPKAEKEPRPKKGGGKPAGRKYVFLALIVFGLAAALLLSDYLSNGLAIGLFKNNAGDIVIKAAGYYAAETGAFTSMRLSEECAARTAELGGAGYIYNDGTFHVLASAHTKKADAEAAASAYDSAGVFTLKIEGKTVAYEGSKQEKEAARNAFAAPPSVFSSMNGWVAGLKSGGITAERCRAEIQELESETRAALDKLNADPGGGESMAVMLIKAELINIANILSDTAGADLDGGGLCRALNYNAVKIICAYKDMAAEI